MKHLIICREYPPAPYPPGGIGVYAVHIARLLAEAGESVHVIGQRWAGAPRTIEQSCDGKLVIHRIAAGDQELYPSLALSLARSDLARAEVSAMEHSAFPAQWFSWVAAGLAEQLVEREGIDVIEAQEWEAPLYFFQLRRAFGFGPPTKPPCIVHLHSPTEFIFAGNQWPRTRADYQSMRRMEDFTIRSADAHLCPSAFLANAGAAHYALTGGVEVIPLPLGQTMRQSRAASVWADGSILFAGRLEPRKGIIEFVEAAVAMARDHPLLRFDFVGANNEYNSAISVRELLASRIPPELKQCFRFYGSRPRKQVLAMLARARIAVVPSRWENFPNTCMEAMSSGLPVLATRNGGMAEMIADGATGWLAPDGPEPLAARIEITLRRALATPPERLAMMGDAACRAIWKTCSNEAITTRHVAFRKRVAEAGSQASRCFPAAYPWPERAQRPVPRPATAVAAVHERSRLTAIVVALPGSDPTPALRGLAGQRQPLDVLLVSRDDPVVEELAPWSPTWLRYNGSSRAAAKALGLSYCAHADDLLLIDAHHELLPDAVSYLAAALDAVPGAGLACGWIETARGDVELGISQPAFPYQWLESGLAGPVIYRRQAIDAVGGIGTDPVEGHEDWDLASRIMAAGWSALRVPGTLSRRSASWQAEVATFGQPNTARTRIVTSLHEIAGLDVVAMLELVGDSGSPVDSGSMSGLPAPVRQGPIAHLGEVMDLPLRGKLELAAAALKQPRAARDFLCWRARNVFGRWNGHG